MSQSTQPKSHASFVKLQNEWSQRRSLNPSRKTISVFKPKACKDTYSNAALMGISNGLVEAVQLTLVGRCKPLNDSRIVKFSNEKGADLADPKQRMAFVLRAAEQFHKLLSSPVSRGQIVQSLQVIAAGGGIR